MYNILIVDDEPIILSGIKFLIKWEKNDCTIMDTARNGREALEKIRAYTIENMAKAHVAIFEKDGR